MSVDRAPASHGTGAVPRERDGKYAPYAQPELGETPLSGQVPQGSFLFPPILHSAAEAIAFWESAEIPDTVCMNTSGEYVAQWAATVEEFPQALWDNQCGRAWDRANPRPADPAQADQWEERRQVAGETFIREQTERLKARPEYLEPRDVRQMCKVIGLNGSRRSLPESERELINEHPIELTTGTTTVAQANNDYGLGQFAYRVRDPVVYDPVNAQQRLVDRMIDVTSVAAAYSGGGGSGGGDAATAAEVRALRKRLDEVAEAIIRAV